MKSQGWMNEGIMGNCTLEGAISLLKRNSNKKGFSFFIDVLAKIWPLERVEIHAERLMATVPRNSVHSEILNSPQLCLILPAMLSYPLEGLTR